MSSKGRSAIPHLLTVLFIRARFVLVATASMALVLAVSGFAQSTFAQGTTVVPPPPRIEREPGSGKGLHQAQQDMNDPESAFDPETGQNLYWDCVKKTWVDAKSGKALGFQGARASDGEVVPPPPRIEREPGSGKGLHQAQQDMNDPESAFDAETGENLYWEPKDKTWRDAKTGKSLGFQGARAKEPCPPKTAAQTTPTSTPSTPQIGLRTPVIELNSLQVSIDKADNETAGVPKPSEETQKAEEKKPGLFESLIPALIPSIGIGIGDERERREKR